MLANTKRIHTCGVGDRYFFLEIIEPVAGAENNLCIWIGDYGGKTINTNLNGNLHNTINNIKI